MLLLLVLLLVQPGPLRAQNAQATTATELVTLNFVNSDIEGVVRVVSEMTGRNFIIDPRVTGTINIIS